MPVPGGTYDMGKQPYIKVKVWYRYYEISPESEEEDREACLEANTQM